MKKVLIVVYYWPPSGGSGVQRWLKFVKYLPQFGYEPHVFTVENGEYHAIDTSLGKDIPKECVVIKRPIFEPFGVYKKFIGKSSFKTVEANVIEESRKGSWKDKIALWIRGNIFIPDARMFWIKPSIEFLSEYLINNGISTVITSGPPQSTYLIGLGLKKKLAIKWIVDFRDPWTKIFYNDALMLTPLAIRRHKKLEKEVITTADRVITVGSQIKIDFETMYGRKVDLITNGFDTTDFALDTEKDKVFSIVHTGTFFANTNPIGLWQALMELVENGVLKNFKLVFYGKVDPQVIASIEEYGLRSFLEVHDYIDHDKINIIQQKARLLLLTIAPAFPILTGKFFEYLGSGSRILGTGSIEVNYEVGNILEETGAGELFDIKDAESIKYFLIQENSVSKKIDRDNNLIMKYSRKNLTQKLIELF